MTIELYTGFVGSGKSFAATKMGVDIADAPFGNRYVIANFPITEKKRLFHQFRKKDKTVKPRWIYRKNTDLTPKFLIEQSLQHGWNKKEGSCTVIFDEASIPFNSRNWNAPDRLEWVEFLTQSRKFGYDFIFITQDGKMLDKQIRALCEYEAQHKKLNNTLYFKWLSLFRITLFAQVSYWNGLKFSKGSLRLYLYSKKYAKRYDTLRLFNYEEETNNG